MLQPALGSAASSPRPAVPEGSGIEPIQEEKLSAERSMENDQDQNTVIIHDSDQNK